MCHSHGLHFTSLSANIIDAFSLLHKVHSSHVPLP